MTWSSCITSSARRAGIPRQWSACLRARRSTWSVGVARQYAGAAGKTTNCQTLVSLTLARDEVPVCLALRLFLPAEWTDDPVRCRIAGVPESQLVYRTKGEIALAEIDRVCATGV